MYTDADLALAQKHVETGERLVREQRERITRLTRNDAPHSRAVAVAIGQPLRRLDIVTAPVDVGQPRARLYPGIDDRDGLAFAAGKLPRLRQIHHQLAAGHRGARGPRRSGSAGPTAP